MNSIDLALLCVLALAALRGWWRGFFRESFGIFALAGGIVAAFRLTPNGQQMLKSVSATIAPLAVQTGIAFVLIFFAVYAVVNLCGWVFERLFGASLVHLMSCLAGCVLGGAKGAAILAFLLLFAHLFPVVPHWDSRIMASSLGRSLVNAAGNAIRAAANSADTPKTT